MSPRPIPSIPVILMTAFGSEELAVKSAADRRGELRAEAEPRSRFGRHGQERLGSRPARHATRAMLGSMTRLESDYVLSNTLEGLDALIGHVKDQLRQMRLFGEHDILRIGTALYESLVNGIEHGNLELRSEQRELPHQEYRRLFEERSLSRTFSQSAHLYECGADSRFGNVCGPR